MIVSNVVYVLLRPDYADWEPALACAEIRQKEQHELVTVGMTAGPVMSLGGFVVLPDTTIGEIDLDAAALVMLPGGPAWREPESPEIVTLLRKVIQKNVHLAAICGATLALARQGILDEVRHTSNSLNYLEEAAPIYKGKALYDERLAITDGKVTTASGAGHVEFAREVVETLGIYEGVELEMWFELFKSGVLPG